MMHNKRRFGVSIVESAERLAVMLTEQTWTLCSGFSVAGHEQYLFLNDATHEDGAGEYAIIKRLDNGIFLQVESITFSWCTAEKALEHIRKCLAGDFDTADYARPLRVHVEPSAKHGTCHLCA